ncbi:DHA2 family efflux MFS transporter permease subunit [Salinibacterium sp. UTAS2018]|uniref:DHA2 family efflux MFS transporter permease subunit n=1 Tax=Salinibacterium sp. UTAS2018 TaxID=2508880 RepID=UPI0010095EA0|nr:DHA2 family efflux MFS transporter permease subunit [Salinibacterium sp. UTAS2018]QAV69655.1 DHA2 family efflux MFS transporter permease subunit [Salinibacterium sp. UTAS2018]
MTRDQRFVLTIAILASFVAFLDGSVINVALPAISSELGGGLSTQQWVVDAYLITLGSLILLAGSLSDVFGRLVILRIGLIGFGLASVFIAIAPSAEMLILLRGVQGIAGALLVPSSLALIMSTFRGTAQAHAIGQWTAWTSAAFIVGPVLGGAFVDLLSWRLVFAINVIPIAITLWLLVKLGHRDERKANTRIDFLGAALGIVGLGGPVFALIEQGNLGWNSPAVVIPLVVGILSFIAFIVWQRRAAQPMLPLELFRHRNFSLGNIATFFIYGALALGGFIMVVYLQEVAGYSATFAGFAFLPSSLAIILLSSFFGRLSGTYGPRLFMTLGPFLAGVGYVTFLSMGESVNYVTQVLPGVLLFSVGMSMTVAPLTSAILGAISAEQAGIGSAVNNAVSRIAGLVTVALIGVIAVGSLSPANFHRVVIVTAALLFAGALTSFLGIRNSAALDDDPSEVAPPLA